MDKLAFVYSGTNLAELAFWILVLTIAGFASRKIVRGKGVLGFLGDAIFGLLGVFLIGTLMNAFEFSLTSLIASVDLGPLNDVTRWVDILLVSFIGALVIRGVLRPLTGKG